MRLSDNMSKHSLECTFNKMAKIMDRKEEENMDRRLTNVHGKRVNMEFGQDS